MARESVKILQGKLDVESLIAQLNAALAEEWLAYYQYWVLYWHLNTLIYKKFHFDRCNIGVTFQPLPPILPPFYQLLVMKYT